MQRRIPGLIDRHFVAAVTRMLSATGFASIAAYLAVNIFPLNATDQSFFALFPKFLSIAFISGVVYLASSRVLNLSEVDPILKKLKVLFFSQMKPPK